MLPFSLMAWRTALFHLLHFSQSATSAVVSGAGPLKPMPVTHSGRSSDWPKEKTRLLSKFCSSERKPSGVNRQ